MDELGALLGQEVFPRNTNETKTLVSVDRQLSEGYDASPAWAPHVVAWG